MSSIPHYFVFDTDNPQFTHIAWQDRIAAMVNNVIDQEYNIKSDCGSKEGFQIFEGVHKENPFKYCIYAFEKQNIYHFLCAHNIDEALMITEAANVALRSGIQCMNAARQRIYDACS